MTEYELVAAAAAMGEVQQGLNETAFAILTGYLLIAHYIGRELSFGQVLFVNMMFILMQAVIHFTGAEKGDLAAYFESEARRLNPEIPFRDVIQGKDAPPVPEIMVVLVTIAALAFMWRVRHPKIE